MGGASKERERASYGDHLVKIGLPPLSSTTVNPAATPTVDRSASCGEPSWRMMNLVAGLAPSASSTPRGVAEARGRTLHDGAAVELAVEQLATSGTGFPAVHVERRLDD